MFVFPLHFVIEIIPAHLLQNPMSYYTFRIKLKYPLCLYWSLGINTKFLRRKNNRHYIHCWREKLLKNLSPGDFFLVLLFIKEKKGEGKKFIQSWLVSQIAILVSKVIFSFVSFNCWNFMLLVLSNIFTRTKKCWITLVTVYTVAYYPSLCPIVS